MENQFKKFYQETLSEFKPSSESDSLSEAIGIDEGRLSELADNFKNYVLNSLEGKKATKRSDVWVGALYHLDPQNLLEVMTIGNMVGAFEYSQLNKNDEADTTLVKLGSYTMLQMVKACQKNNDWEEAVKSVKEFHEIIEQTF
jgi:hypothetical protein